MNTPRPLPSLPATRCVVTHAHREDITARSTDRVARTLVRDEAADPPTYLRPIRADDFRVYGEIVATSAITAEWVPVNPPVSWCPGRAPLVIPGEDAPPPSIGFITTAELERRRHARAEQILVDALNPTTPTIPADRIAAAEYADLMLGGDAVALSAIASIGQTHDIDVDPHLGRRLIAAAPAGFAAWSTAIARMPRLNGRPDLRKELVAGFDRTLSEADRLDGEAWSGIYERTRVRWWLGLTCHRHGGIRPAAHHLEISPKSLRRALRTGLLSEAVLPPARHVDDELRAALLSDDEVASSLTLAQMNDERFDLFGTQLATLERLTSDASRLAKWNNIKADVRRIGDALLGLEAQPEWERAELAARELRDHLRRSHRSPLDPLTILDEMATALAGATLFHKQQLGAWSSPGSTAPVIILGASQLHDARSLSRLRFSIAHQLGHIVESLIPGWRASPCTLIEDTRDSVPHERFANAFAAYLLAPRDGVRAQVGYRFDGQNDDWLLDATLDVGRTFGLGARAAAYHLLNSFRVSDAEERVERLSQRSDWIQRAVALAEYTEDNRASEREALETLIGKTPPVDVDSALRRPSSARFDDLVHQAASNGQLSATTCERLLAA